LKSGVGKRSGNGFVTRVVLDASAFLAVIHAERGSDTVAAQLDDAVICSVNFAEVITKIVERGASIEQARKKLALLDVPVIDFDMALAERTGTLRAETKSYGLSLGDRACLALAEREGVKAMTSDRRWAEAGLKIAVELIR
jgi:ribonuclease VapC